MKDVAWVLFIAVLWFVWVSLWPYDDTDNVESEKRSGLVLYIDHGTGCHWLAPGSLFGGGALVPRLDAEGKHVCTGDTNE